jgi:hypothetical protein
VHEAKSRSRHGCPSLASSVWNGQGARSNPDSIVQRARVKLPGTKEVPYHSHLPVVSPSASAYLHEATLKYKRHSHPTWLSAGVLLIHQTT